jgi:hypothetical protein
MGNPLVEAKTILGGSNGAQNVQDSRLRIPPYPLVIIIVFLKKSRNRVKDVFYKKKDPIFEWE